MGNGSSSGGSGGSSDKRDDSKSRPSRCNVNFNPSPSDHTRCSGVSSGDPYSSSSGRLDNRERKGGNQNRNQNRNRNQTRNRNQKKNIIMITQRDPEYKVSESFTGILQFRHLASGGICRVHDEFCYVHFKNGKVVATTMTPDGDQTFTNRCGHLHPTSDLFQMGIRESEIKDIDPLI